MKTEEQIKEAFGIVYLCGAAQQHGAEEIDGSEWALWLTCGALAWALDDRDPKRAEMRGDFESLLNSTIAEFDQAAANVRDRNKPTA